MTTIEVAKAEGEAKAVATAQHALVETLLREAGQSAATMLAKIKEAAKIVASGFDASKTVAEKVAAGMAEYASVLLEIGDHNVKANFNSCLWLLAATAVNVEVPVAGKKDAVASIPASEAINQSKHTLRDAAKQVREAVGAARAPGAGRKTTAAGATVTVTAAQPTFFDTLEVMLGDPGNFARVVAAIEKRGYTVTRKEHVTPAEPTVDKTEALAQALVDTVPSGALALAVKKNKGFVKPTTK